MRIIAFITDAATVRDLLAHRRTRATAPGPKTEPAVSSNHPISPSAWSRQAVIRCLNRHLVRLDLLSFIADRSTSFQNRER
jgi:hypothetical protein